MFKPDQYQQEAEKYRQRADNASKPAEAAEFRALERSFDTLADNARWIAEHQDGIVPVADRERGSEAPSMSLSSEHVAANSARRTSREFYLSSSGDQWALISDVDTGEARVRHTANPASGGHMTEIDLGGFLTAGNKSPEQQALLRLISQLAF